MKVQFSVTAQDAGWLLRRGNVEVRSFDSCDQALTVAERFARAAAANGNTATVNVFAGGELQDTRSFVPDIF